MTKGGRALKTVHPVAALLFYIAVIIFTALFPHPAVLFIMFAASFLSAVSLRGRKSVRFLITFCIPMMIIVTAVNPLFNHRGVSVLFYLFNNPVTLEAVIYGFLNGVMLCGLLMWFYSFSFVMDSGKFIYLFGRIIPKTALILSMTLRFIPLFIRRIKTVAAARNMIGKGIRGNGFVKKVRFGLKTLFAAITWSLENGIESEVSMRSRGYGIKGRTSFTPYRFIRSDFVFVLFTVYFSAVIIAGIILNALPYGFFPVMFFYFEGAKSVIFLCAAAALSFMPFILNTYYNIRIKYSLKGMGAALWN